MEKKIIKTKCIKEDEKLKEDIKKKTKRKNNKNSKSKTKSKPKSKPKDLTDDTKDIKQKKPKKQISIFESMNIKPILPENTDMYPEFPKNKEKIKIISWNINGLRPLIKSEELDKLIQKEDPDIICFNETKIDINSIKANKYDTLFKEKYKSYWHSSSEKKGYSGTAIFTKYEPISISTESAENFKHDDEGRVIVIEYEPFILVCCYTPNSGEGLKRLEYRVNTWDKDFFEYMVKLKDKNKNIILCGDLNVAVEDIDIYEPKGHSKTPGFTDKERESFRNFMNMGFMDCFRNMHPNESKFSYFSKRVKSMKSSNKGWRLDYFVVPDDFDYNVINCDMLNKDEYNSSDHIPIIFECEMSSEKVEEE